MAVIGPGTGMGCAGLLRNAAGWHAIPGEGGHVTLSGRTAFEREVLAAAAEQMDHVSAEKLLSGIGLPLLYRAVATVRSHDAGAAAAAGSAGHHGSRRTPAATRSAARWSKPSAACSAATPATSR